LRSIRNVYFSEEAIGGLLGGLLTGGLSWRWIFFVNVPVGAALLALAAGRLPRFDSDSGRRPLDVAGAITVTGGLTALVWALIRSDEAGWGWHPELAYLLGNCRLARIATVGKDGRHIRSSGWVLAVDTRDPGM
jgi:MFS family permease